MDNNRKFRLYIESKVRSVLEMRRLKDEDIKKTLSEAERTGKKFVHPVSRHFLAGMRQDNVSVWVEYGLREDGYEIYKAYQYRLTISAWDLKTGRALSEPVWGIQINKKSIYIERVLELESVFLNPSRMKVFDDCKA